MPNGFLFTHSAISVKTLSLKTLILSKALYNLLSRISNQLSVVVCASNPMLGRRTARYLELGYQLA